MTKLYAFAVLFIVYGLIVYEPSPIKRPPGVNVAESPIQGEYKRPSQEILYKGYSLKPRAEITLKAMLLSKERYWFFDSLAKVVPYDFALGWGRMSDQAIIDRYRISQGARFYIWSYSGAAPLPEGEVIGSSANMHLIPKSEAIFDNMKNVRVGNLIKLKGLLVDVAKNQNSLVRTSLTRSDSGSGACEVVLVEELSVLD